MLPFGNKTWEQIRKNYFKKNKFTTTAFICERNLCEEKLFAKVRSIPKKVQCVCHLNLKGENNHLIIIIFL